MFAADMTSDSFKSCEICMTVRALVFGSRLSVATCFEWMSGRNMALQRRRSREFDIALLAVLHD